MKTLACSILILSLSLPVLAYAHPETGLLPDAIAETEYKIALEMDPRDTGTRNNLGLVFYRKNKLKEAEREFSEVLRTAPKDFHAHEGMGLVRLKTGKNAEAVAWFQKAILLNPEDTMVHHSLGQAFEQSGQLPMAEASYRQGLEVNKRLLKKGVNRHQEMDRKKLLVAALKNVKNKMRR